MKYLTDYLNPLVSDVLDTYGAFFAFSDRSFEEQRDTERPKEDYCTVRGYPGLVVLKDTVDEIVSQLRKVYADAIQQDITENGKEAVIRRELNNHEAMCTMDPTDTIAALAGYDITEEEVLNMLKTMKAGE